MRERRPSKMKVWKFRVFRTQPNKANRKLRVLGLALVLDGIGVGGFIL